VNEAGLVAALREFAERIDALDAAPPGITRIDLRIGSASVALAPPVAHALAEALRAYRDPRDHGECDNCGGRRVDGNFRCADCGHLGGVFGQLVRERAARYPGPPPELR
jgi:hypothetical protein